ncbi:hypothetical protein GVN24_27355 [Rhizobium sp. CRIBSB]|nr:hypothetical protein [Rhizobium sp. CRIBSB]
MHEYAGARHDRRQRMGVYVLIFLGLLIAGLLAFAMLRPARTFKAEPAEAPVVASTSRERVADDQARFAEGEARRD